MSEEELVKNIIDDAAKGYGLKNRLIYDSHTKRLRPTGYGSDPDSCFSLGVEDTSFSVGRRF